VVSADTHKKWASLLQRSSGEDYADFMERLQTTTKSVNVAPFTKFGKTSPQLVSSQLVSVQPMTGSVGLTFYKNFRRGQDEDEEPIFKLDVPVQSLHEWKFKNGERRKIIGLITGIGEIKGEPVATVEDAATEETFSLYFHEMEKVSLLVVIATAAK
jgi:hypothetical protein